MDLLTLLDAPNPLLSDAAAPVIDPAIINPSTIRRRIPAKRQIEDMRRIETAREAVAGLDRDGSEIYGLTRGQFSLTDMIEAIIDITGPAALTCSTWTAAQTDVGRMLQLLGSGRISSARWLVDATFIRRAPALVAEIRRQFGDDALRVTKTHAKFVILTNNEWQVALRSSMNLNQNPRLESFEVGHDPALCAFLSGVADQIWQRQPRQLADAGCSAHTGWWNEQG